MNRYLENVKEIISKNKKKLIRGASILIASVVVVGAAGVITIYGIAKSNINYTIDEAKEIALQSVQGEIVRVYKKLDLDSFSFEYKFSIKDTNNMLMKVTVDASLGAITDVDSYYD